MNEITLPPSPNWYASNILACSKRGTLAWGAKNFIVIARQEKDDTLQYSLINDPSTNYDRINAVAFCPHDDLTEPELLITGSDNDIIRIWNVDSLELVVEFSFNNGSKTIVGVDWSTTNVAYAVTSDGHLMCCNVQYESSKVVSLGKLTATCLACCPHQAAFVAIGTKSGLIYIVDKEKILYKLRGHNEEISSLSWCPSPRNVFNVSDKKDLLLASGGKDKFVYIWRAGRDGRYEMMLNLPNAPSTNCQTHKSKLSGKGGMWTAVCWAEPKTLLTSSMWGELLSWNLSTLDTTVNSTKFKCVHKVVHAYHNRGLFCIAVKSSNDNDTSSSDWRATSELTIWTSAQDRWLVCCKRDNNSEPILKYKIPTQAGFVYCIAPCPIETSRIAIGVGDEMLRLWNLSESQTFDILMHWQKIKGKIRTISWFPEDESTVAFGTSEGRIGMFEAIDSVSKPPILFRQYHRNIVYKIEWVQLDSEYYLFSCSERELVAFKKSNPDADPISIMQGGCTEFAWKSNICLAVAVANGSIIFYDQSLKKLGSTIHIVRSIVNCLTWHPDSTSTDKWMSPYANYLAVASDSHNILIYDLTELIQILKASTTPSEVSTRDNFDSEESSKTYKLVATLKGHSNKVICLAWSPHISGHLVSGSYDGTAQVWNVEKQELLSTFHGHNGPVLSCMWSPLKPQFIITGSSDFTLRVWDYNTVSQSQFTKKAKFEKKIQSKTDDSSKNDSINSVNTECTKSNTSVYKKKEKKCYFNRYNKLASKDKILDFIKTELRKNPNENQENSLDDLSLFCEKREDFLTIIATEQSLQEDLNTVAEMSMWWNRSESGYIISLENHLRQAAKNQELNDFLVSLAPSISARMWREMCDAYAHQLIIQKNIEKAVSYLLCTHQIYEAIEVFLKARMYKESYALARSRLDGNDPIIKKVLLNWSEYSSETGQLEQAAHCHIKLGNLEKAAEILARRKDVRCLELASELAFLNGDEEYGVSLLLHAIKHALIKLQWSKARSLIANIRKLQYLNVLIDVHETIMSLYGKHTLKLFLAWLQKGENNGVLQSLNKEYDASYYEVLCKDEIINAASKKEDETNAVYLSTSYELAKAVLCTTKETYIIKLKHVAKAVNIAFENEKVLIEKAAKHGTRADNRFFIFLLTMLGGKPTDEPDENNIYARNDYFVSQSIRAYLCFGILDWILIYSDQLSAEEETMCTQLMLNLLADAISETAMLYENRFNEIDELATQLTDFMCSSNYNKEGYDKLMMEMEKLKVIENEFKTDRVCMPNPSIIFSKTCSVVDRLHDEENKYKLLDYLNTLCETGKIKPLTLENHLLVKLKFLRQNLTLSTTKQCTLNDDTLGNDASDNALENSASNDALENGASNDALENGASDGALENDS